MFVFFSHLGLVDRAGILMTVAFVPATIFRFVLRRQPATYAEVLRTKRAGVMLLFVTGLMATTGLPSAFASLGSRFRGPTVGEALVAMLPVLAIPLFCGMALYCIGRHFEDRFLVDQL